MADQNELEQIALRIQTALQNNQVEEASTLLQELHPADQADVFQRLNDREQSLVFPTLSIIATAELLEELEDDEVLEAVEDLSIEQLADVLDEMEPDEAADLLGDLPPEQASEVLAQMEDAEEVRPLLGYPDETAGGLMTTWYIGMRRQTTIQQAIEFLRQIEPETEVPYYLYVIDREKRLVGVVGLRSLVVSDPKKTMESVMDPEVIYVTAGTDQEEVAEVMTRYDLTSLPVVDHQHRLIGVVTHDDITDVLEDEATEDILHLGAVESAGLLDKSYWEQNIFNVVRSRFIWLLALFFAGTLTGIVLKNYEDELQTVVALSFFIPLLMGTGGNAGAQTVATVIRGMALREVRVRDIFRVWWREFRAGILLGAMLSIVAIVLGLFWQVDLPLAITVGITIAVITTFANTVAAIVPILATAIGLDPTIASGPMISTVIDASGLLIYFTLAALILPQL